MVSMSESDFAVVAARLSRNSASEEDPKKAFPLMLERALQEQIVSFLRAKGIFVDVSRMDRRTTNTVGRPDLLCAHNGKPFAFEVKTATGKCSEEQLRVHEQMRSNGWTVMVVRSVEEVRDALRKVE